MILKKSGLIGDVLIAEGFIRKDELQQGLKAASNGQRLGEILIGLGYIKEEELLAALGKQFRIPVVRLSNYPLDPSCLNTFPKRFVERHRLIPVQLKDNILTIVTANPLAVNLFHEIESMSGYKIELLLSSRDEIERAIHKHYGPGADTVDSITAEIDQPAVRDLEGDVRELEGLANEAPVIKLVDLIIKEAIRARASDIHLEPFEAKMAVRYRIDGVLYDTSPPPAHLHPAIVSRIKIMAGLDIAERRLPQDGRIGLRLEGRDIDLRVSTLPTLYGEVVVIRILDRGSILLELEELGLEKEVLNDYKALIERPNGIILVTGPTGSGKTTTLYASLTRINDTTRKIITVEDPIEYNLPRINQMAVNPRIGLSFARGLRSMLRQDPDILMVGEIRDLETAEIAIRAASTGHLVFTTLHTNDAASSITRLLDMGIESYLVSSSVIGILAQRLVRLNCSHCAEEYQPDPVILLRLGTGINRDKGQKFRRGKGCDECGMTGFRGRKGIFELLVMRNELRKLILEKADASRIKEIALRLGMKTLRQDGWLKVKQGMTTPEEVLRVTQGDED